MSSNRETGRDALYALLAAALVGDGKPCEAGYSYKPKDFEGKNPVFAITGAGTGRKGMTFRGNRATFFYVVNSWVLYTDKADWNRDDAEDALDLIEKTVNDVLSHDDNKRTDAWESIAYTTKSEIYVTTIGGDPYLWELIPVEIEVFG